MMISFTSYTLLVLSFLLTVSAVKYYTANGDLCVSECVANTNGNYRCLTETSWDYCSSQGVVTVQNVPQGCTVSRTLQDRGNGFQIVWCMFTATNMLTQYSNAIETDANYAISDLITLKTSQQIAKLVTRQHVRIDLQGKFNRYNKRWANIQLQVNNINSPSTIAVASIEIKSCNDEEIFLIRYVRDCLLKSLLSKKHCWLQKNQLQS